ncbi:hypothetical protein E3O25_03095 [Cryobacterium sp. TMT1-3]|uniref:Uncharacterized protein n=2 Tax=Cryobacterium TaxID=69578 RepID=A0A4R8ZXM8_9MICO|nr:MULTISPECIES: hypothetical protein [Cryobacterium]TFB84242.1 hypothetical protein E3O10_16400 [Cryobacterium luteum]TFC30678.1 hypothetical protein E3O25_03095 [Cryobacterium sp. TMT1-3]TFD48528.1 hypothetical protein E3T55_13355 [Cryobacterium frigoriphilum]
MAKIDDDGHSAKEPIRSAPQDPPFQALLPNLERMSPSTFRKGTVSRRRVNRALLVLLAVTGLAGAMIVSSFIL